MLRCGAGNSAYSSWAHEQLDMKPATKTNIQEHQNPLYNLELMSIRTRLLLKPMLTILGYQLSMTVTLV
jgi:hypothetical protein